MRIEGVLTWGCFALVTGPDEQGHQGVLLKRRPLDQKWDLPGGGMNGDETSPFQTVSREVYEELGLSVYKIGGQVGPDHPFKIEKTGVVDIARIWRCKVTGQPQVSNEADAFGYFTEQTIRALTLVGPEGRLGRTGRMVWDGLSILRDPVDVRQFSVLYSVHEDDYVVSPDGLHLHHVIDRTISIWRRLDPYGTDGYMEAPKK